jgi:AcrR family transcriptional regulator
VSFQRARNEEQRAERRQAILATAEAMLADMPVAELSLNELARRVGLAKSNVLRYFGSREAVLLELLGDACREWRAELERLPAADGDVRERCDALAAALASSAEARPVLCDLLAAQASVLERNVSAEVAARFKRAALAEVSALAEVVRHRIPELTAEDAVKFVGAAMMSTGAVWSHTCPSTAMLAAYEADPALAALRLPLRETLQELFAVLLAGLLARTANPVAQRANTQ